MSSHQNISALFCPESRSCIDPVRQQFGLELARIRQQWQLDDYPLRDPDRFIAELVIKLGRMYREAGRRKSDKLAIDIMANHCDRHMMHAISCRDFSRLTKKAYDCELISHLARRVAGRI